MVNAKNITKVRVIATSLCLNQPLVSMIKDDLLKAWRSGILAYEHKPGRLFQSVTQASYDTWSDGPFGRTGDDFS